MKKISIGYTLIELVVTVALLAIVLMSGTAIFYKSFRSSGISDVHTVVDNDLRSLGEMLEKTLRYGTVVRIGDSTRVECLASVDGVSDSSLIVRDLSGREAIYTLDGEQLSLNSAIISNPEIRVTNLEFTWYCRSGVNDKMNLLITATSSLITGEVASSTLNKDIYLLNSGIN